MEQKKHPGKIFFGICCAVYIIIMLLLLYAKGCSAQAYRIHTAELNGYWQTVRRYTNFELLKAIRPFLQWAPTFSLYDKIMNQVVGNILIFIPAGIFLPVYFKKQRRLRSFFVTSLLMILFVEISQVLSFLGSFDVDDILLNLIGCLSGWLIFKIIYGILRLFKIVS